MLFFLRFPALIDRMFSALSRSKGTLKLSGIIQLKNIKIIFSQFALDFGRLSPVHMYPFTLFVVETNYVM